MEKLVHIEGHRHQGGTTDKKTDAIIQDKSDQSIKMAGVLNVIADASHNFTDGMAIAASFTASPQLGLTTTLAVLVHEIPHEIGDYAILIQSGFSSSNAMMMQLVTAVGALLGVVVGLLTGGMSSETAWILPFTAGGFIYISLVSVVPSLLEQTNTVQTIVEVAAMCLGVWLMVLIGEFEH